MDVTEMQDVFDDLYDQAIVFHGFTTYMRDYEIHVQARSGLSTHRSPDNVRL